MLYPWEMPEIALYLENSGVCAGSDFCARLLAGSFVCQLVSCNSTFAPLPLMSLQLTLLIRKF